MQRREFFHRFLPVKNSIQITGGVHWSEAKKYIWGFWAFFSVNSPRLRCWSLTFEIIIYDPKQLSGLRLSWDQEFQEPLKGWRNLGVRFVCHSVRSSTFTYQHYPSSQSSSSSRPVYRLLRTITAKEVDGIPTGCYLKERGIAALFYKADIICTYGRGS